MSEEAEIKPGLKFDGTIHLGHLLVFVGMVGSVISLYATFVAQNERTNYRLDNIEKVISDQGQYNKTVLDILNRLQINQAVTQERLNRMTPRNGIPHPQQQSQRDGL